MNIKFNIKTRISNIRSSIVCRRAQKPLKKYCEAKKTEAELYPLIIQNNLKIKGIENAHNVFLKEQLLQNAPKIDEETHVVFKLDRQNMLISSKADKLAKKADKYYKIIEKVLKRELKRGFKKAKAVMNTAKKAERDSNIKRSVADALNSQQTLYRVMDFHAKERSNLNFVAKVFSEDVMIPRLQKSRNDISIASEATDDMLADMLNQSILN